MKEKLLRFEELKLAKKQLEAEENELKDEIRDYMVEKGFTETDDLEAGKIVVGVAKTWQYSDEVKKLQALEKQNGDASCKETVFIKYQMFK